MNTQNAADNGSRLDKTAVIEVVRNVRRVLAELEIASDGPMKALAHERSTSTSAVRPRASEPQGVRLDRPSMQTQAPPKSLSLHAHYTWHFKHANGDVERIRRLISMAECDLARFRGHQTPTRHEHHDEAVRVLLMDHAGKPAIEVAYELDTSVRWVRRQRVMAKRDPTTGERRELSERKRRIIELADEGLTQTEIAKVVGGITQPYVSQVLNGHA